MGRVTKTFGSVGSLDGSSGSYLQTKGCVTQVFYRTQNVTLASDKLMNLESDDGVLNHH